MPFKKMISSLFAAFFILIFLFTPLVGGVYIISEWYDPAPPGHFCHGSVLVSSLHGDRAC